MGLAVNEGKTKYKLSTSRDMLHIDSQIAADNYTFDTAKEFIYQDRSRTTKLILYILPVLLYGLESIREKISYQSQ